MQAQQQQQQRQVPLAATQRMPQQWQRRQQPPSFSQRQAAAASRPLAASLQQSQTKPQQQQPRPHHSRSDPSFDFLKWDHRGYARTYGRARNYPSIVPLKHQRRYQNVITWPPENLGAASSSAAAVAGETASKEAAEANKAEEAAAAEKAERAEAAREEAIKPAAPGEPKMRHAARSILIPEGCVVNDKGHVIRLGTRRAEVMLRKDPTNLDDTDEANFVFPPAGARLDPATAIRQNIPLMPLDEPSPDDFWPEYNIMYQYEAPIAKWSVTRRQPVDHHIPGYLAYIPQEKFVFGKSFGRSSAQSINTRRVNQLESQGHRATRLASITAKK